MNRSAWMVWVVLALMPTAVHAITIAQIQQDPSLVGQIVTVEQAVVTAGSNTFGTVGIRTYIQDPGGGPWTGIMLYKPDGSLVLNRGDLVTVTGEVNEYYDLTEIMDPTVTVIGSDTPASHDILTSEIQLEENESCLVKVNDVTVSDTTGWAAWGEWFVDDGSGQGLVDDWANYNGINPGYTYEPNPGDWIEWMVGIINYYYDFQLEPRDDDDFGEIVAVELTSFEAAYEAGAVVLRWTTQTEQDNFGFHVHRSETADGPFTRITQDVIPGGGSCAEPRSYLYRDTDVRAGTAYWYKLEDVELSGRSTFHGPVRVVTGSGATSWGRVKASYAG
jgi:hypothetical protein